MRVVVTEFMTLDGVMENPQWTFPYWNDEMAQFKREEQLASEALLLGRVTYEMFAAVWPSRTEAESPGADRFNAMPKYVASTTLKEAAWNATIIAGDVPEAVRAMRERPGGDLVVHGSATLAHTLIAHDLVDEYRLAVYPVIVGGGKRLFTERMDTANLRLVESTTTEKGVLLLRYHPARDTDTD